MKEDNDAEKNDKKDPAGFPVHMPVFHSLCGGIRSGMGYCGTPTIADLHRNGRFVRISAAGLKESHPHDIQITKEAPNYSMEDA